MNMEEEVDVPVIERLYIKTASFEGGLSAFRDALERGEEMRVEAVGFSSRDEAHRHTGSLMVKVLATNDVEGDEHRFAALYLRVSSFHENGSLHLSRPANKDDHVEFVVEGFDSDEHEGEMLWQFSRCVSSYLFRVGVDTMPTG